MEEMAVGDFDVCSHHDNSKVVLFCQTCEELVCTRCVSQAPNAWARHKDHVYLDLTDAYDMQREEFEKLLAHYKDHMYRQKQDRQDAHSRLQKLKLEVLRKRTQMEKRARSLKDKLKTAEAGFLNQIEQVAAPAVQQLEEEYTELDYEVVSGDGLLCTAESICKLPPEDNIMFLKNAMKVKRELQAKVDNTSNMCTETRRKPAPKSVPLQKVSLNLQGEKRALGKAFCFPTHVPSSPRVLLSWCVVGRNRACLTWKYSAADKVDRFNVYIRPVKEPSVFSKLSLGKLIPREDETTYTKIPIHKFNAGRSQAILRHLKKNTTYIVKLCACNVVGESSPAVTYFMTTDASNASNSNAGQVWVRGHKTPGKWRQIVTSSFWVMAGLAVASLFIVLLLFLIFTTYEDILCEKLVHTYGTQEFYKTCPFPPPPTPQPTTPMPDLPQEVPDIVYQPAGTEDEGSWFNLSWLDIEF